MKEYVFSGEITQGKGTQPFERTVEANSMKHAKDKLYSTLCSEHSVKRSKITVEEENEA
ncbi:50S ribosomal protein L18Ae [Candidatus Nanohalococcus occultus]|uniref:Large ribosomal subunit protein eL20 n=1 Tax=Candidatus Nanohalococcus occultus TaxID=2978047 RepID=A0ABY8CFC5_9ARCH|nr:Ribosomal protein L20A (L18A) [Candidatus Nanohaloarchaeota archaeon SVXNc]